jgi:hypothetical protein
MKSLCALTAVFLSCLGAQCLAQEVPKNPSRQEWRDIIGTHLSGSDCEPAESAKDQGGRICKGVEGYSILLEGDELKPEVYLIAPNQRRYPVRYWNTSDPNYHGLQGGVTWTVIHTPRKTVAVIFTAEVAPRQDYSYNGSYDIIARVTPSPVCIVGSVSASSTSAAASIAIATSPSGRRCLNLNEREKKDWFATAGRLASEGQIKTARLALTRVHKPSQRFIVFHEMASAQIKAGNSEGARRTLMGARAEALRNPLPDDLKYTLIHVVAGMAESGFYEDAKSDIKLFPKSERLRMYLMVADIQWRKTDIVAAKKTFQEAIQLELKRYPRADWNLSEIGVAQVRIGLVDEARKTASMIRDPSIRNEIERSIRERPH